MKTLRLPASMSMLQVDRELAAQNLKCVRFIPGRASSNKDDRPERRHFVIVTDAS